MAAVLMNAASPKQNLVYPVPKESQHGVLAPNVIRTFLQEDEFNFNLTQGTHVNMTLVLKSGGPNGVRVILGPVDDKGNQEPPYLYTTILQQAGSAVTWTGTVAVSAGYRIELTNMDMTAAAVQVYFWAS